MNAESCSHDPSSCSAGRLLLSSATVLQACELSAALNFPCANIFATNLKSTFFLVPQRRSSPQLPAPIRDFVTVVWRVRGGGEVGGQRASVTTPSSLASAHEAPSRFSLPALAGPSWPVNLLLPRGTQPRRKNGAGISHSLRRSDCAHSEEREWCCIVDESRR